MFQKLKATVVRSSAFLGTVVATAVAGVTTVHAALPTEVTTAVSAAKVDIGEAGALGIGIFLAIMIFMWLRRVMR